MSVLNRLACSQKRRDEVPNQELAAALTKTKDRKGIREVANNLWNDSAQVQSDCLKVLYEIGYLNPALIAAHADDFLDLLASNNNRLVWGAMIALSTIAPLQAAEIYKRRSAILTAMERGSVITIDNAVKTLALVAAANDRRCKELFPVLLAHLQRCRPKEIPQHSEKALPAVTARNKASFVEILENRLSEMTAAQVRRVKRVIKQATQR
jgi:hypothetical protein